MFRSDLESAMARAEQLEGDLDQQRHRAEEAEQRVHELERQIASQRTELERLQARLGARPANTGSKTRAPRRGRVLSAVIVATVAIAGIAVGVLRPHHRALPSHKVATAPAQLGAEQLSFVDYVSQLADSCAISSSGYLRNCHPPASRKELLRAETRVGAQTALMGYCKLLAQSDKPVSRLAAHRIGSFYRTKLQAVDGKVFTCLDEILRHRSLPSSQKRVLQTWAALGVQNGHKKDVLTRLATLPSDRRAAGYRGLWRAVGLAVLPELKQLARDQDPTIVEAVVRGFDSLTNDELRAGACPVLAEVLERRTEHKLLGQAAYRSTLSCKGRNDELVLRIAAKQLDSASAVDYWWVAAISNIARGRYQPQDAHRRAAMSLLADVAKDPRRANYRRKQALESLARADLGAGKRIAKSLLGQSKNILRAAAERISKQ